MSEKGNGTVMTTQTSQSEPVATGPNIPLEDFEAFVKDSSESAVDVEESSEPSFSPSDVTSSPNSPPLGKDEAQDDPFAALLRDEYGEDNADDEQSEDENADEVETKPEQEEEVEEDKPRKSRASDRIRQLNEKAKKAKESEQAALKTADQIKSQALAMKTQFDQAYGKLYQEFQRQAQMLQQAQAQMAELSKRSDEELPDDPAERIKRQIARELREKELAPLKSELEQYKKARQEEEKRQADALKEQRIKAGAAALKESTAQALKDVLLKGVDTDPLDDLEKKLLSAAMLGFQANKISPADAALHLRKIVLKLSSAMLKSTSKARSKTLEKSASIPGTPKRAPVQSSAAEPSNEELRAAGLSRPQWKLLGSPPLTK